MSNENHPDILEVLPSPSGIRTREDRLRWYSKLRSLVHRRLYGSTFDKVLTGYDAYQAGLIGLWDGKQASFSVPRQGADGEFSMLASQTRIIDVPDFSIYRLGGGNHLSESLILADDIVSDDGYMTAAVMGNIEYSNHSFSTTGAYGLWWYNLSCSLTFREQQGILGSNADNISQDLPIGNKAAAASVASPDGWTLPFFLSVTRRMPPTTQGYLQFAVGLEQQTDINSPATPYIQADFTGVRALVFRRTAF